MLFLFFFFKQKTAYEMRISDWSSDVCSSDLKTSKEIQESIRQVLAVLGEASDGASSYRQTLQENVGSLHSDSSIEDLRAVVQTVVGETRTMIEQHRTLENVMGDSSTGVDAWRTNLDVVLDDSLIETIVGIP